MLLYRILFLFFLTLFFSTCKKSKFNEENPSSASKSEVIPDPTEVIPVATVYPVDPKVHVNDKSKNVTDPSSFQPTISNATAQARYALNGIITTTRLNGTDVDSMVSAVTNESQKQLLSGEKLTTLWQVSSTPEEAEAYIKSLSNNHTIEGYSKSLSERSITLKKQIALCSSNTDPEKLSKNSCCTALMAPYFLLEDWNSMGPEARTAMLSNKKEPYQWIRSQAKDNEPFRLQGIKAWTSLCLATVQNAPSTLTEFEKQVGEYKKWRSELHPTSRAKLAGRRIYRKDAVSVAESLRADCSVDETEVVQARSDGEMQFLTYDSQGNNSEVGFFNSPAQTTNLKFTPDSCMGCHYTFDTRSFSLRFPSYSALRLPSKIFDGLPRPPNETSCAKEGEVIVRHD